MNAFTLAVLSLAVCAGSSGAVILVFRERVLRFVRVRYEKVFREEGLSEAEIRSRLPKMWAVVLIGLGCLVVAAISATAGWVGALQCATVAAH